jgi:predicted nucleic acid-binding protein
VSDPAGRDRPRILLDTGPLGRLANPDVRVAITAEIRTWLTKRLTDGAVIYLPEIADYELRRELLRLERTRSLARLDELQMDLHYLPLDTPTMRRAAQLWAEVRKQGRPTADPKALDADVILAAQAEQVGGIVATENAGHLARFVTALHWRDIR